MTDEIKKTEGEVTAEMVPKEQYIRLLADFENYKKDQVRLTGEMAKWAGQATVMDMIDVMDLVSSAVEHASEAVKSDKAWYGGLEQVGKRFIEVMKKHGVNRITTAGKAFDPVTMEAVQMVPGGESQMVEAEVHAGYVMHDRVIRPARVIIYQ